MLLSMEDCSRWVPIRWPDDWRDVSLLELLKGTPVNCLVVGWGKENLPPAFLEQGRQVGLSFVGIVDAASDRAAALSSAKSAGVAAVAVADPAGVGLPAIAWAEKAKLPWGSKAGAFAVSDAVWPSIPPRKTAEGGPTGAPWVDSNGWIIQLARTRAQGRPVWVAAAPPKIDFVRTAQYLLAISDAYAYGGRWVITLDEKLRAALRDRKTPALTMWKNMMNAVRFFEQHRDWERFAVQANIAVISDFSGDNEFAGNEILNLLPRRGVPYRIVEKAHAADVPLNGMKGVLYPDGEPPAEAVRKKLAEFAESGGVVVASAKWPAPQGLTPTMDSYRRWNVYAIGKGRLAIAKEEGQDPYLTAGDAQVLISRRNDLVRYFNFQSLNGYYTAAADGRKAVLHTVNYAMRTFGHPVSVAFMRRYRSARMWRFDAESPTALEAAATETGVEVHLPPFGVYAAIELDA